MKEKKFNLTSGTWHGMAKSASFAGFACNFCKTLQRLQSARLGMAYELMQLGCDSMARRMMSFCTWNASASLLQ